MKIRVCGIFLCFTFFGCPSNDGSGSAKSWDGADYHEHSASQKSAAGHLLERYTFKGDESVLDVGCGDGKITASIARDSTDGHVVGLDVSDSMIEFARRAYPNEQNSKLKFVLQNAEKMKFKNEFDLVTSFTALQWVRDQRAALSGIHKALKSGGEVLVTMPAGYPGCLQKSIDEVIALPKWSENFVGFTPGQVFYNEVEYKGLMRAAGFINIVVEQIPMFDKFDDAKAFSDFVKQWLPWAQPIPEESREAFMAEIMQRYLQVCPADRDGKVWFYKYQIEAHGKKSDA